jgi:type II secretion system protein H
MKRRNPQCGFTLLELVLVMVILALMFALASPSLRGWSRGQTVRNSGDEFVALTRLARSQAIADATTYRLNVDAAAGQYWLTKQSGTSFVDVASDIGHKFSVPENGQIRMSNSQNAQATYFDFLSTGRCDPGQVVITDDEKNSVTAQCDSPAENFYVVNPQQPS